MDLNPLRATHMLGYVEGADKLFCKSKLTSKHDDIMSILQDAEVSDSSNELYCQVKANRLFAGGVPLIHKSQEKGNSSPQGTSNVHSIAISSDLRDKKLNQPKIRNFLHERESRLQDQRKRKKTMTQIPTQEKVLVRDNLEVLRSSSRKLESKQQNRKRRAAQSDEDYHFPRRYKRRIGQGEKVTLATKRRRPSCISTLPTRVSHEEVTTTPAAQTDEDTEIVEFYTTSTGLCTRGEKEELWTYKRRSTRIAMLSQPANHEEVMSTTSAKSLSLNEASNELIKDEETNCGSQRKQLPTTVSHPAETLPSELHESGVSLAEAKEKIKEILRTFSVLYMQAAVVPEDERVRTQKKGKKCTAYCEEPNHQQFCRRPDLKALHIMLQSGPHWNLSNSSQPIGSIPGISVNHVFKSRAEMVVVGMHRRWMGGIDYISKGGMNLPENADYALPLAVCIVVAGRYEDDEDFLHEIVYAGEGGNRDIARGRRRSVGRQIKDQKLNRGNLGLSNSMRFEKPVRVVRKGSSDQSYSHSLYTYAGLYEVHTVDCVKGVSGFRVFKFYLRRLPGQATLTSCQQCSSMST